MQPGQLKLTRLRELACSAAAASRSSSLDCHQPLGFMQQLPPSCTDAARCWDTEAAPGLHGRNKRRARGSGTKPAQQRPGCCDGSTQPCNLRGLTCSSPPCPFTPEGFRRVWAPQGLWPRKPCCCARYQKLPCTRNVPGAHQIALQDRGQMESAAQLPPPSFS